MGVASGAEPGSPARAEPVEVVLSLPAIHCATCLSAIERLLIAVPGVRQARVNLTLKRAHIKAAPSVGAAHLVSVLQQAGHEAYELDPAALAATRGDRAGQDLLIRLAVAGFALMNVMLLSISVWAGAEAATRDLFHWISAAIALPVVLFSGKPFYASAWRALRGYRLNMDVPIVLAIVLALATSLWETMLSGAHAYFDAALALVFFLLVGRYLEHRARAAARSAAGELAALEVPRALRLRGEQEESTPLHDLAEGDVVLVHPGARMPVDGLVVQGCSEVDRSLLTGETMPEFVQAGQAVCAGAINLTGPLRVRATSAGVNTSLHRMAELVAVAEEGRSRYRSLADAAVKLYAPGVHLLALVAFAGWYLYSLDLRIALNVAAAVLIITCPCALGLAVPAVSAAASGRLFRKGLLVKHATALERLAQVDMVIFDKTGTLTRGAPRLVNGAALDAEHFAIAYALARASAHPLARAIVVAAQRAGVAAAQVGAVEETPGYGTQGLWRGQRVRLGRAHWAGAAALLEGDWTEGDSGAEDPASTMASYLQIGDSPPICLRFTDSLRPGAIKAVAALHRAGIAVQLLSGDSQAAVQDVAARAGITDWVHGARPEDKLRHITRLAQKGHRVLMVGDGLNDTAALAGAHVSIAPASALDAARVAADIVLLGTQVDPIAQTIAIAQKATQRIRENFAIATLYNAIALPLAMAGLATPLIAALAMSASSITVSLNALRLGAQDRRLL